MKITKLFNFELGIGLTEALNRQIDRVPSSSSGPGAAHDSDARAGSQTLSRQRMDRQTDRQTEPPRSCPTVIERARALAAGRGRQGPDSAAWTDRSDRKLALVTNQHRGLHSAW